MRTYLYSYLHRGHAYSFEIPAEDIHEADDRLRSIRFGEVRYDGELAAKVPAFPSAGPLVRLWTWVRNQRQLF